VNAVTLNATHTTIADSLETVDRQQWNRLVAGNNPFLKHEFLSALERHRCVGKESGWQPQHLLVHDEDKQLLGASPLYIKYHSHGEFVFDWAWAEAYQRNHLAYYPKLVSAIPFTPMTGQRLLIAEDCDQEQIGRRLIDAAIELAEGLDYSSVHWLFPTEAQKERFQQQGLIIRMGCQYHWHNRGYKDFDDYLSHFSSRKRKNVLKERRQVETAGVTFRRLHGDEISAAEWTLFHRFYREIYDRKWGFPSLTLGFFEEIGRTLADQVVLVLAYRNNKCIATALNMRSDDTLYGRHWGCSEQLPGLHFEACYYQGLEYCMEHGLQCFEPGAQGEHKIARGFLPTATWSAHWIGHPEFRDAIARYTKLEAKELAGHMRQLESHSPFSTPP
jgi:predicted N-acyltransferase